MPTINKDAMQAAINTLWAEEATLIRAIATLFSLNQGTLA
jgi:hypothetical protein